MPAISPFRECEKDLKRTRSALKTYQIAINKIDDYFEYRNKSVKDREEVQVILAALSNCLEDIYGD